jgi:phosphatidylinositol-3-phosphatase
MRAILVTFFICFILLGTALGAGIASLSVNGDGRGVIPVMLPQASSHFDYILIIVMENRAFSSIYGNSSAPFLNQLAASYSLAASYTATSHPSLPNYLTLTGASTFDVAAECAPTSSLCNSGASCCSIPAPNIVDRIESAGLTWKAYMEDYPGTCGLSCSVGSCFLGSSNSGYAAAHDPFVYYSDIISDSARCARIVSANSMISNSPQTDDKLLADLGSASTASNFMWLSPDRCDSMHDCSISSGDNFLHKLVPQILNSYIFKTQKALLFITFDEGPLSVGYPSDYVFTVLAGPVARVEYKSSAQYSHYSLLNTIETEWGLQNLTLNDHGASTMQEFLNAPTSLTILGLEPPLFFGVTVSAVLAAVGGIVIGYGRRRPSHGATDGRPSPWKSAGVITVVMVETILVAFFSFWVIEEYLNNAYFQIYLNQFTNSNRLAIVVAIVVTVSGCVAALVRSRFTSRS